MFKSNSGHLYFGDCAQGDRIATAEEIAAWELARQPTYKQLRATEFNRKSPGEQFAMMHDDKVNGTDEWVKWQTGIKDRIPEP